MRCLWLGSVIIYFFLAIPQASVADYKPPVECSVCSGYHICGFKGSNLPHCVNGHPCTRDQYRLCVKMLSRNPNGRCDRPGTFPDHGNSTNFYKCVIKEKTSKMMKFPLKCPSNTSFDATTLRCLTREERTALKAAEEVDLRMRSTEETFQCRRYGVFPNPHDCKKYHVCDSKLKSQEFYCPVGTYFGNDTCVATKTPQCIEQLMRESEREIKEAHIRYRHLRHVMIRNLHRTSSRHNFSLALKDRVVKRSFPGLAGMRHIIYAVPAEESPESMTYAREAATNVERVIENIITKYAATENGMIDSFKLQAAVQKETLNIPGIIRQRKLLLKPEHCKTNNFSQWDQNCPSMTVIAISASECTKCYTTTDGTNTVDIKDANTAQSNEEFLSSTTYTVTTARQTKTSPVTTESTEESSTTETETTTEQTETSPITTESTEESSTTETETTTEQTETTTEQTETPPITTESTEESSTTETETTTEQTETSPITTESTEESSTTETETTTEQTETTTEQTETPPITTESTEESSTTETETTTEQTETSPITTESTEESSTTETETTTEQTETSPITTESTEESSTTETETTTEQTETPPITTESTEESSTTETETTTEQTETTTEQTETTTEQTEITTEQTETTTEQTETTTEQTETPPITTESTEESSRTQSESTIELLFLNHSYNPTSRAVFNTSNVEGLSDIKHGEPESFARTFTINQATAFLTDSETMKSTKTNTVTPIITSIESASSATRKPKSFRCPYVGYFRDPADCHSFYRCRRVAVSMPNCPNCVSGKWKLVPTHHTCENGLWFSNFFWKCVKTRPLAC